MPATPRPRHSDTLTAAHATAQRLDELITRLCRRLGISAAEVSWWVSRAASHPQARRQVQMARRVIDWSLPAVSRVPALPAQPPQGLRA